MSDFADLLRYVLELGRRLDAHEVATRNMFRVGPVKERDHKKGVRIEHGTDEASDLGPWVQPSERSGVERDLPNMKEQLAVLSPYGDPEQGITIPFGHSKEKPNPSADGDESTIFNRGKFSIKVNNKSGVVTIKNDKASIVISGDKITNEVDGNKTEHSSGEVKFGKGKVKHNGANIGEDHTHKGVTPGGGSSQAPNE